CKAWALPLMVQSLSLLVRRSIHLTATSMAATALLTLSRMDMVVLLPELLTSRLIQSTTTRLLLTIPLQLTKTRQSPLTSLPMTPMLMATLAHCKAWALPLMVQSLSLLGRRSTHLTATSMAATALLMLSPMDMVVLLPELLTSRLIQSTMLLWPTTNRSAPTAIRPKPLHLAAVIWKHQPRT